MANQIIEQPATDECPRLWYVFADGEWTYHTSEIDLTRYYWKKSSGEQPGPGPEPGPTPEFKHSRIEYVGSDDLEIEKVKEHEGHEIPAVECLQVNSGKISFNEEYDANVIPFIISVEESNLENYDVTTESEADYMIISGELDEESKSFSGLMKVSEVPMSGYVKLIWTPKSTDIAAVDPEEFGIEVMDEVKLESKPIEVTTPEEFEQAISSGESNIVLNQDMSVESPLRLTSNADITINSALTSNGNYVFIVDEGASINILGSGTIEATKSGARAIAINNNSHLTIDFDGLIKSDTNVAIDVHEGAELIIDNANVEAVESCVLAASRNSKVTINGGNFICSDNGVIMGNGTSGNNGNHIVINGGTFNGQITSAGYIACGIYVPNDDIVEVNAGTFNITKGCGILARAGQVTIGSQVVINTTGDELGKVGDSRVVVPCSAIVFDAEANYPALTEEAKITIESGASLSSEDSHGVTYILPNDQTQRIDDKR